MPTPRGWLGPGDAPLPQGRGMGGAEGPPEGAAWEVMHKDLKCLISWKEHKMHQRPPQSASWAQETAVPGDRFRLSHPDSVLFHSRMRACIQIVAAAASLGRPGLASR